MKDKITTIVLLIVWSVCFFLLGVVATLLASEYTYAKTGDLSKENVETINVSTDAEKSLVEEIRGVTGVYEQGFSEEDEIAEYTDEEIYASRDWFEVVCTAYCGCEICVGKWHTDGYTLTASGWDAEENWTIAADEMYPFGTVIYIEGLGERMVMDRGSAIHGNHIDLYYETHEQACEWGMQTRRAYIVGMPE